MSGARSRRAAKVKALYPDLTNDLKGHGQECDDLWWARKDSREHWYELTTPISKNSRGDNPIAESNFRVAERLLDERSSFGTSYRWDLWPGGQIQTLVIRADDPMAVKTLGEIIMALEDYPILDDQDHSQEEWDQNHPSDSECYSDYEDCCPHLSEQVDQVD